MESLLAIDAGTTHIKAGLFNREGKIVRIANRDTPVETAGEGYRIIDPERLWQEVLAAVKALEVQAVRTSIAGIGIASMAESGLFIDRSDGRPRSAIFPWFDTSAESCVAAIRKIAGENEHFLVSGVYPSFKCSLAKIMWARQYLDINIGNCVWLSVADFISYRLSGCLASEYSLAGRTDAFDIVHKKWDGDWLKAFDLSVEQFPSAFPAGHPSGGLQPEVASTLGLTAGIPVCIAGHDHICASLAVGAFQPGVVLDSMGTAEALVGSFPERELTERELLSGFSIGCSVVPDRFYWIGGLSTSGGAIEWVRSLVSADPLDYSDIDAILAAGSEGPGEITFYPYLAGAGSPHRDPDRRGAFTGIRFNHQLADLLKAILEGTAFEVELMRRQGEQLTGQPIERLIATGGGTRNRRWMQVKADVSGCRYELAQTSESVLLGAAMLAGIGAGLYSGPDDAFTAVAKPSAVIYGPRPQLHRLYLEKFEVEFLNNQGKMKEFSRQN